MKGNSLENSFLSLIMVSQSLTNMLLKVTEVDGYSLWPRPGHICIYSTVRMWLGPPNHFVNMVIMNKTHLDEVPRAVTKACRSPPIKIKGFCRVIAK